MNIYLTDSDEEAIVDFAKDHKEIYNKESGRETSTSQSQSRHKKGHTMNIYLTDSDEEAIVDFVKDLQQEQQGQEIMPVG